MVDASWAAQQEVKRQFTNVSWYKRGLPIVSPALFLAAVAFLVVTALL